MSEDDDRPRIFGKAATPIGEIELTVQGSADEDATDIEDTFDRRLEKLANVQDELAEERDDDSKIGVE